MASPAPKKISSKPEAELAPRRGDEVLSSEELQQFELFAQLKKPISVEKFPGSVVLRKFRKGATICRQGDRGHSAFYIASAEDLRRLEALRSGGDVPAVTADVSDSSKRRVATAYLLSGAAVAAPRFFSRLFAGRPRAAQRAQPTFIPNDGPTDIDYRTRQAEMLEGQVFGEMSCMTLAPRSATIVADEDCYVIEFLRNIFDKVQSDAGYRERADKVYAQRVLDTHLGRLEIFQGLTEPQLETLRQAAYLEVVEPGTVICDEGDRSDSVYIIRSGVVQVVRGAHVELRVADVADWPSFCQALLAGADGDGAATKAPAGSAAKPRPAAGVADILAAARGGGGGKTMTKRGTGAAASVADIMAAARGGKKPTVTPADATTAGVSPTAEEPRPAAEKPDPTKLDATKLDPTKSDPTKSDQVKAKPTRASGPADILAAARAGAAKKEKVPGTVAKPAMSTADILAAAKKSPAAPSAAELAATSAPEGDADTLLVTAPPKPAGRPQRYVWDWFAPRVQAAIRSIADNTPAADDRELVIRAINQLICRRDFVASKDVTATFEQADFREIVGSFPRGIAGAKKQWSELDVRVAGLLALRAIYQDPFLRNSVRPNILAYLSRGDCFGEMALVLDAPRQATCIAYDHPVDDSNRKPGRVELVRIDGAAFKRLIDASPVLKAKVDGLVERRYVDIVAGELQPEGTADESPTHWREYQDLGLAQGQSLLLIDLDRCTRCGDCVRACQNTHDDGRSRLFLDGPRFDRFLIPAACRQCLNPACMIGCPVGSIQRGNNGQIEIRDWCIGCKLCADQCPYDSIQMHDIGIIPEQTVGWQFAPASAVAGRNWQARGYRARNWAIGLAPFQWTLDLFEQLVARAPTGVWQADDAGLPEPICFRYPFDLSRSQFKRGPFSLNVSSSGCVVRVWLNGQVIAAEDPANPNKNKKQDDVSARLTSSDLRVGRNVLAVQVSPPEQPTGGGNYLPKYNQPILTARLDVLPRAGEVAKATAGAGVDLEVELVKKQAVVCDLCSSLATQRPACVDQCPHEAAIRINAQFAFPET